MSRFRRFVLRWSHEESYRALSYGFVVRTNHRAARRRLRPLLEPFRAGTNGGPVSTYSLLHRRRRHRTRFVVRRDGETVLRSDRMEAAVDQVIWEVHDDAIRASDRFLALHAAGASFGDRGLLFPAAPNSGKSTLVAALMRRGFAFLTDEYAIVDLERQRLHPYPRPLWLTPGALGMLVARGATVPERFTKGNGVKHFVPAEAIRAGAVGAPCRVRYVIVPDYDPGGPTAIEPLSRGWVLMQLADEAFNFGAFGARGLAALRDLVAGADCYRLQISDIDEAVGVVRELVGG